jgi:hypothetical protein
MILTTTATATATAAAATATTTIMQGIYNYIPKQIMFLRYAML